MSLESDAETRRFLDKRSAGCDDEDDETEDRHYTTLPKRKGPKQVWQTYKWPLIHVACILCYSLAALAAIWIQTRPKPLNNGPLQDLDLRYQTRTYTNLTGNPFWGEPSPSLEAAWDELLEGINIKVTTAELSRSKQQSIQLQESEGHLAWLTMHHDLHCLRHVHKYVYRDVYAPNRTEHEEVHMKLHMDHCLDSMRQASLCRVDTALRTFEWLPGVDEPVFVIKEPERQCVDWKAVLRSTQDRQVSEEEIERLQSPLQTPQDSARQ